MLHGTSASMRRRRSAFHPARLRREGNDSGRQLSGTRLASSAPASRSIASLMVRPPSSARRSWSRLARITCHTATNGSLSVTTHHEAGQSKHKGSPTEHCLDPVARVLHQGPTSQTRAHIARKQALRERGGKVAGVGGHLKQRVDAGALVLHHRHEGH
eukprot:1195246-Prorocentrum_minimum.AAC.4